MGLNLDDEGEGNLFPHSKEFDEGVTQRGIRPGQSTVVVALDGSGDAETIQEGVDMLPSTGGIVFIKEGTFIIKQKITINNNNTRIEGTGRGTVIQASGNIEMIEAVAKNNIVVQNLFLDGNSTTSTGILLENCDGCLVMNVWLESMGDGIYFDSGTTRSKIVNNWFKTMSALAIQVDDGVETLISNNHIDTCGTDGISINGLLDCIVEGNYIDNCTSEGIRFSGQDNSIIASNRVLSCGVGIIIFNNTCDKNIIIGNQCIGNTTAITDNGTNTHPNEFSGENALALSDLNIIA